MVLVQGKRGVWIKLPIELVSLVEPAVKVSYENFSYLLRMLFANSNVAAASHCFRKDSIFTMRNLSI